MPDARNKKIPPQNEGKVPEAPQNAAHAVMKIPRDAGTDRIYRSNGLSRRYEKPAFICTRCGTQHRGPPGMVSSCRGTV